MPIKWNITAKAMKARGIMDQISAEYDGFIEGGSEHLADVKGLRSQVGDMQDDLQSAANVMGNSGGASNGTGEPVQPAKVPPATYAPDPPKTIMAPPGLVEDMEPARVEVIPAPSHPPSS